MEALCENASRSRRAERDQQRGLCLFLGSRSKTHKPAAWGLGGSTVVAETRLGGLEDRLQGERENHYGGGKDNWGLGTSVGEGEDNCGEHRSLWGREITIGRGDDTAECRDHYYGGWGLLLLPLRLPLTQQEVPICPCKNPGGLCS